MNRKARTFASALSFVALAWSTGCGFTPATDINRVQPNYVPKTQFEGEWLVRPIIVDKNYTNAAVFEGYEGNVDLIRWEITQDRLLAFRSFEKMPGAESDDPGEQTLVAAFPIISHFDIRRQYNAVNGVENNVIEENTFDRPWWERDYIRVDWSADVAGTFDMWGLDLASVIQPITGGSVVARNTPEAEPANPYRLRIEDDYIEVTFDGMAYPDEYACWALGAEGFTCASANVKVKLSFLKRDPVKAADYDAINYPDRIAQRYGTVENAFGAVNFCFDGDPDCELRDLWTTYGPFGEEVCDPTVHNPDACYQATTEVFDRFGFFRTDRYSYDRENGVTVTGREQLINRWNIWKKNIGDDGQPIPYAEREPKTIVYYLNPGFPESLIDATLEQADDWNMAFLDTIAELKGMTIADVQSTYGKDGQPFRGYEVRVNDCNPDNVNAFVSSMKDEFDLAAEVRAEGYSLDNLGAGNLENVCAVLEFHSKAQGLSKTFDWQHFGDLRYSFINWVDNAEPAGPLGYGPSASDPITGQIISANANIYGASLDTYANWAGDIVQLLNGEIDDGDVMNGTHIREHVEAVRARYAQQQTSDEEAIAFMNLVNDRTAHLSDEQYLPPLPLNAVNRNIDRVRDAGFDREMLLTDEAIRLFGGPQANLANGQYSDEMINAALPSTWGRSKIPEAILPADAAVSNSNPLDKAGTLKTMRKLAEFQDLMGRKNFCFFSDQIEPAVADLAYDLKGKSRADAVQYARHHIMRGVLAHEVGHTVGLRHNFEGSADPMNYFPGYWGVETGDHRDSFNRRPMELAYSSIMDYHQRFNGDWGGVGLYDKAAIKFGYGELIEVFDERQGSFLPRSADSDWTEILWLFYPDDLPYLFGGSDTVSKLDQLYSDVTDELYYSGNFEAFMDVKSIGIEPKAENLYKRRSVPFKQWLRQDVMRFFGMSNPDGTPLQIAVPYKYCSDTFAWGGNLTCNRFDMGATSQEIVKNAAEMYDFYYPFYTYQGARRGEGWAAGWFSRIYDRMYQPMLNSFRYYYYYRRSTAQIWPRFLDWSKAAHDGMNFFYRVLQTPDTGAYCLVNGMYKPENEVTGACTDRIELERGMAREFQTTFTDALDYRVVHVGHVWDKILALQAIASNDAFFARDFSDFVDRSAFNIGYYRVFAPELSKLFTGLVLGKGEAYAPQVKLNGTTELVFTPIVNFRNETPDPVAGPMIQPSSSYLMKLFSLYWSMVGFTSNVDYTLDYAQRAKIAIAGSSDDPSYEGVPSVLFTDPNSLVQYRAHAVDGSEDSLGYALLTDAQDYVDTVWTPAKAAFDAANAGDANYNELRAAFYKADAGLAEKMQFIDTTRYLATILDSGN